LLQIIEIYLKVNYEQKAGFPVKIDVHYGQRKLFVSELEFLSTYHADFVIYAGAAPSVKAFYLSELFPELKFILIDPNIFRIIVNVKGKQASYYRPPQQFRGITYTKKWNNDKFNNFVKDKNKILIVQDFFTNEIAEKLSNLNLVFISDIRTQAEEEEHPTDLDVLWNFAQMTSWIKILKPKGSCIKFRLPYLNMEKSIFAKKSKDYKETFDIAKKHGIDFTEDYRLNIFRFFEGEVRIQAWAGRASTESRLFIGEKLKLKSYGITDYEATFNFYNIIYRNFTLHKFDKNYILKKDLYDYCNDCGIEYKAWKTYFSYKNIQVRNLNWYRDKLTQYSNFKFPENKFHGKITSVKSILEIIEGAQIKSNIINLSKYYKKSENKILKCLEECERRREFILLPYPYSTLRAVEENIFIISMILFRKNYPHAQNKKQDILGFLLPYLYSL